MKKILFLLAVAGIALVSCFNYLPAVNYQKDMTAPYLIQVNFSNGNCDTMEVEDFRAVNVWSSGPRNAMYQIKPVGGRSYMTINNVSYIKILQACKKPQKVQIQRTYNNNPHNYNYNYWD